MLRKNSPQYIGQELELFSKAINWGQYVEDLIKPHISGFVIEVGAGMGTRTQALGKLSNHWLALEPDINMCEHMSRVFTQSGNMENVEVFNGTLAEIDQDIRADTIIYIDVLEHIKDDWSEIQTAFSKLRKGGSLVVLSPAHEWLYTNFDKAIGHQRRYGKKRLINLSPKDSQLLECKYIDSAGLLASLGNKSILRNEMPTKTQIQLWDKKLVPLSRILDSIFRFKVGKSIFIAWRKL